MGVLFRWIKGNKPTFEVYDDVLVLRALAEIGVSPRVFDDPKPAGGLADGRAAAEHQHEPWMAPGLFGDHPSHWLLFIQFSGYARAVDNGWLLKGLRKSRYSAEQAEAEAKATLRRMGITHVESARWLKPDGSPGSTH